MVMMGEDNQIEPQSELQKALARCPRRGARFRSHYGDEVVIIGCAFIQGTSEALVLYQPADVEDMTPSLMAARTLKSWESPARYKGKLVPRFTLVTG